MAAIPENTDPDPCPIESGDQFRTRSKARLTVLDIERTDGTPRACIERKRHGRRSRFWIPLGDVRKRVRGGAWVRVESR